MLYKGDYTREISFPIGGIGTGSFGIAGNGSFVDWEIFNRPAKGKILDFSHIMLKAKKADGRVILKLLCGDVIKDLTGTYRKTSYSGFGFGPDVGTLSGVPHFKSCIFDGEFPIAKLTFEDDGFPATVVMTVFNPFIPLDSENSSLPAGFFNIELLPKNNEKIDYTVIFTMRNPFDGKGVNECVERDGRKTLFLSASVDKESVEYGDISVTTDCKMTEVQPYWYRGSWYTDCLTVFMRELSESDTLIPRVYKDVDKHGDAGSVAAHLNSSGETVSVRFVLAWNMPNNYNYWAKKEVRPWKNYYATRFASSLESSAYCIENFESLYKRTLSFKNALFETTVAPVIIEAVSSTMSVLKTATVLRLEDGSFYGWEGVHETAGSCEGTCQHVWNYAYALCFLFPDLERSIRDNEFKYCTYENGKTIFRMALPRDDAKLSYPACLDGQMGTVIKTYREWKISGDTEWLKSNWETVKRILSFAWSKENDHAWDRDKDGVLEGRQHHTLDCELFGPSSWLEGFYLGALRAGSEMAKALGDTEAAKEFEAVFESGYKWTKENLFNGEYFFHKVDVKDKGLSDAFNCSGYYWNAEAGELCYQVANGCEIDQVCGQWHANICGLGRLYDGEQLKTALKSLYKYNFKPKMRDFVNTWRIFALNDEAGTIMCSYPKNDMPMVPLSYYAECMTGFEYALAALMISEGMEKEGLEMVKAIRDRYDGKKRNPWNEIECGSNYARAMASYSLLPIYSGFSFDMPNKQIGFSPLHKDSFKSFFSVGGAWGTVEFSKDSVKVDIIEGALELGSFKLSEKVRAVLIDGNAVPFEQNDNIISFNNASIKQGVSFLI